MRVVLGMLVGLACLAGSEWPLREKAPVLSSWLAGAGIAILYTASWAAHAVYDIVPSWAAGALMIATTAACAAISSRRDSLPTALLGLAGGFLTPLALSTGEDRPVPLFSYLLMLDVGLLWLSHRQRWPALAWLSLGGTAFYQLAWLFGGMRAETGFIGIGVVLLFGAVYGAYAIFAPRPEGEDSVSSAWLGAVSSLLPFLLALSFVGRDVLADHLYVVGPLLVVLDLAAVFVARRTNTPFIALGAATGSLGVLLVWLVSHSLEGALGWEFVATLMVLALLFHVVAEIERTSLAYGGVALLSLFGAAIIGIIVSMTVTSSLAPFVVLAILVALVATRHAELPERGWVGALAGAMFGAALAAIELSTFWGSTRVAERITDHEPFGALAMVLVALFQITALVPRSTEARRGADHGSALAALALLGVRAAELSLLGSPAGSLVSQLALATLVLFAATRLAVPAYAGVAIVIAAARATETVFVQGTQLDASSMLVVVAITIVVFAAWPAFAGPRYRNDGWAWRTAALAGPLYFFAARQLWLRTFGHEAIGLLPVSLAAISLGALSLARVRGPDDDGVRRTALAWPAAVTAGFVTLAIPLQLSNEWLTIGWALEGAAVLWLFRRIDHAGLKWLGAALFAAVAVRLLVNPYVLGYYPRGELRIVNWIAYTYLVPAAAMIAGHVALATIETARLRPMEQTLYPENVPVLARTLFAGALATIFAWINLAIFDAYASGPALTIPTEHMPARDLTVSIAWAAYALAMLALGVWRKSSGLRWTSLALIVVTCFKVFLYDLAHLHDLYRVAALVGLAFSLLAISLLYQRFVFRRPASSAEVSS
jgi:uncharacterized membrane protein